MTVFVKFQPPLKPKIHSHFTFKIEKQSWRHGSAGDARHGSSLLTNIGGVVQKELDSTGSQRERLLDILGYQPPGYTGKEMLLAQPMTKAHLPPELHSFTPSFGVWWLAFYLLSAARPLISSQCCQDPFFLYLHQYCDSKYGFPSVTIQILTKTVTLTTVPSFFSSTQSLFIYHLWNLNQVSILGLFTVLSNLFAVLPTVHLSQQVAHLCHHIHLPC